MSFIVNVPGGRLCGTAPSLRSTHSMAVARAMRATPPMRIAVGALAAVFVLEGLPYDRQVKLPKPTSAS